MSNHISPSEVEMVILKFKNDVKVLVNCNDWSKKVIKKVVENEVYNFKITQESSLVWELESSLQYDFGLTMALLDKNDILSRVEVIEIPYPYDLGEQETEADIQKLYPEYKYPYKK